MGSCGRISITEKLSCLSVSKQTAFQPFIHRLIEERLTLAIVDFSDAVETSRIPRLPEEQARDHAKRPHTEANEAASDGSHDGGKCKGTEAKVCRWTPQSLVGNTKSVESYNTLRYKWLSNFWRELSKPGLDWTELVGWAGLSDRAGLAFRVPSPKLLSLSYSGPFKAAFRRALLSLG